MERWCGKVAIVTGASSGIGEAIAEDLVKAGMQVVGLARRAERVQTNADRLSSCKGKLHAVKCDMTKESDIKDAFAWTTKNLGCVQVLVNNAGVMQPTNLIAGDTKKWKAVLDTNVLGLCIATREACKLMMENKVSGHIVHMNSIVGHSHLYFPTGGLYGASKHAVTNLTELLRQELLLNKAPIKITSISPGMVRSELVGEEAFSPEMREKVKDMPFMETEDISAAVLYVLGTPERVHVNEITLRPTFSRF